MGKEERRQNPGHSAELRSARTDADERARPAPPVRLRDPETLLLFESEVERRRREAAHLVRITDYVQAKVTAAEDEHYGWEPAQPLSAGERIDRAATVRRAWQAALMYAAQALNTSEHYVATVCSTVEYVREHLPRTWDAFCTGHFTWAHLTKTCAAARQSDCPETLAEIDRALPGVAETYRPRAAARWVAEQIATQEPASSAERFAEQAKDRYIQVFDEGNGMSTLFARLDTVTAHSIRNRLNAAARSSRQPIPHNPMIADGVELRRRQDELRALRARRKSENAENGTSAIAAVQSCDPATISTPEQTYGMGPVAREGRPNGIDTSHALPTTLPTTRESGDPRTIGQRAADLLSAWVLNGRTEGGIPVQAEIGLLVPESTITGESDLPAMLRDRSGFVPAEFIRNFLRRQSDNLTWYELTHRESTLERNSADPPHPGQETEPDDETDISRVPSSSDTTEATGPPGDSASSDVPAEGSPPMVELTSLRSSGRFPPPRLRKFVLFRDGTCSVEGCNVPAESCDVDHILPWPEGPTEPDNLQLLCRKHHGLKTAGFDLVYSPNPLELAWAA